MDLMIPMILTPSCWKLGIKLRVVEAEVRVGFVRVELFVDELLVSDKKTLSTE